LAVGLALQGSLANFAAGILLIVFRPFKVDDLIEGAGVLDDPPARIAVLEMADSSVNFVVRPWVKTEHYWDVYFGVTENIKKKFDAEGISIPFPQRDVHLFQEKL
jgi:small conductance mechanosensitive channel